MKTGNLLNSNVRQWHVVQLCYITKNNLHYARARAELKQAKKDIKVHQKEAKEAAREEKRTKRQYEREQWTMNNEHLRECRSAPSSGHVV